MSDGLAIAAVTALLKNRLVQRLSREDISALVGTVKVSAQSPDLVTPPFDEKRVNLFLYQVNPNLGWRNAELPTRDARGDLLTSPTLALDLHYLLTAYAGDDGLAEVLLGYGMQALHDAPLFTRNGIRDIVEKWRPVHGDDWQQKLSAANLAGLADQAETIKLSPQALSTEEISKLWSAFQTKYHPTVAYQVSVVLIQDDHEVRVPLPVLSRGRPIPEEDRDEGVAVQPDLIQPFPPYPTLQDVTPPNQQPAFQIHEVVGEAETLTFTGHHLDGDEVVARFTHIRTRDCLELSADDTPEPTEVGFSVTLPTTNLDDWQIGVYSVAAVVRHTGVPPEERTTNELPLALAPRIKEPVLVSEAGGQCVFTVKCSPKVYKGQSVMLVVGEREATADEFTVEKTEELTFRFAKESLPDEAYWVRLRVDGVESLLIDRTKTPPEFDPNQRVPMP